MSWSMAKNLAKNPPRPKENTEWQQDNGLSEIRQLDVLEEYLRQQGYKYIRRPMFDIMPGAGEQIVVLDRNGNRIWDAICGLGTYGGSHGLLEFMGSISGRGGRKLEGWLTAGDIIKELERQQGIKS